MNWFRVCGLMVSLAAVGASRATPPAPMLPPQVSEALIDAPPAAVWNVFSTPEGWKALGVAQCEMEFHIGGLIRTHYTPAPDGVLGDDGTIENEILAFEPERMLSMRIHTPPKSFPFPNSWQGTWSVITLEDAGDGRTRLRLAGLGYRDDEESRRMLGFFQKGNDWTFTQLKQRFTRVEAEPDHRAEVNAVPTPGPIEILSRLAGGDFIADFPPPPGAPAGSPGAKFHTRWDRGPSAGFLVGQGWLGHDRGMRLHGLLVVGVDPATGETRLWNFGDRDDIARGGVRSATPSSVEMEWTRDLPLGRSDRHRVTLTVTSDGGYTLRIDPSPGSGGSVGAFEVHYRRVSKVPDEYRVLPDAAGGP